MKDFDIGLWYSGNGFYQSQVLKASDIKKKIEDKRFVRVYLRFNGRYNKNNNTPKFVMAIGRAKDNSLEELTDDYANSREDYDSMREKLDEISGELQEARRLIGMVVDNAENYDDNYHYACGCLQIIDSILEGLD